MERRYQSYRKLIDFRDNLVDNFSTHKEEVDKILAEQAKKLGISR